MLESDDLYATLQVHPAADPDVIQAAYKRLVLRYHPDRNKSPGAAEVMKRLNHAYEVLRDPARREAYDRERALRGSLGAGGRSQSPGYRTTHVEPENARRTPPTSPGAGPYGHTRAPGAGAWTSSGGRSTYSGSSFSGSRYSQTRPQSEAAEPPPPPGDAGLGSRLTSSAFWRELSNIPVTASSVIVVSLGLLALVGGIIAILFVGGGNGSGHASRPASDGPGGLAALNPATPAPTRTRIPTRTRVPTPTYVLGFPASTLSPSATPDPAASLTPTPARPPLEEYVHPEGRWQITHLEGQKAGGPWLAGDVEVVEFASPGTNDVLQVYRFIGHGASGNLDSWAFDRAASRDELEIYTTFKLTSMEKASLGRYPAYRAGYLMESSSLTSSAVALLLFAGDDAYEVVGSTSIDRWNELDELIEEMVHSFRLSP